MSQYQQAIIAYVANPTTRNARRVQVLAGLRPTIGAHLAPIPLGRYPR